MPIVVDFVKSMNTFVESSSQKGEKMSDKKILEKSPLSGIAVPIAIILVGALIIFGISKMLSTGKDYRDLVEELHSKTFRNRWTTAYELSKYIASNAIPKEDIPWVVENLNQVYLSSLEPRTRNFVVLALSALGHKDAIITFNKAMTDEDGKVRFNSIVGIGKLELDEGIDWEKLKELTTGEDAGVKQAVLLAAAKHRKVEFIPILKTNLVNTDKTIRFAAARALINFKDEESLNVLKQILDHNYGDPKLNDAQIEALKLSTMRVLMNNKWKVLKKELMLVSENDASEKVKLKAKEVLNSLKNW